MVVPKIFPTLYWTPEKMVYTLAFGVEVKVVLGSNSFAALLSFSPIAISSAVGAVY